MHGVILTFIIVFVGLRSLTGAKTLPNGETGLTEDEANTYKEILAKITRYIL